MGHIGIDQYGDHYHLGRHPRKELLEKLGRKRASKMYVDRNGTVRHVGYVIAGRWIDVYKMSPAFGEGR